MKFPVIEHDANFKHLYRVYVGGTYVAVVIFVLDLSRYFCIDITHGSIFSGSTCYKAVEIYFNNCFKECLCNE